MIDVDSRLLWASPVGVLLDVQGLYWIEEWAFGKQLEREQTTQEHAVKFLEKLRIHISVVNS